jgi:hypothetical protein
VKWDVHSIDCLRQGGYDRSKTLTQPLPTTGRPGLLSRSGECNFISTIVAPCSNFRCSLLPLLDIRSVVEKRGFFETEFTVRPLIGKHEEKEKGCAFDPLLAKEERSHW